MAKMPAGWAAVRGRRCRYALALAAQRAACSAGDTSARGAELAAGQVPRQAPRCARRPAGLAAGRLGQRHHHRHRRGGWRCAGRPAARVAVQRRRSRPASSPCRTRRAVRITSAVSGKNSSVIALRRRPAERRAAPRSCRRSTSMAPGCRPAAGRAAKARVEFTPVQRGRTLQRQRERNSPSSGMHSLRQTSQEALSLTSMAGLPQRGLRLEIGRRRSAAPAAAPCPRSRSWRGCRSGSSCGTGQAISPVSDAGRQASRSARSAGRNRRRSSSRCASCGLVRDLQADPDRLCPGATPSRRMARRSSARTCGVGDHAPILDCDCAAAGMQAAGRPLAASVADQECEKAISPSVRRVEFGRLQVTLRAGGTLPADAQAAQARSTTATALRGALLLDLGDDHGPDLAGVRNVACRRRAGSRSLRPPSPPMSDGRAPCRDTRGGAASCS